MGKVDKGFYRGVEPVAVVSASNTESLRQGLRAAIARGNPSVPRLRRSEYPPPVLLKYAGVKSWSTFQQGMSTWSIKEKNGSYEIVGYRRHLTSRSSVEDPDQKIEFPAGTAVDSVVERMIAILQEAARQRPS
jgi:hypothetical protein